MAHSTVSLPDISADRRNIRRLSRMACPAGVAWVRDVRHPEAAAGVELPFIFVAGRLRRVLDPFAEQRPNGGSRRAIREIDLLVAAMLQNDPDVSAATIKGAAASYAAWVLAKVPTVHARLRGLALAGWWPTWSAA